MANSGVQFEISIPNANIIADKLNTDSVEVRTELKKALEKSAITVQREIMIAAPHGVTGDLARDVGIEFVELSAIVKPKKKYAIFVEKGTKPHTPPISAIEPWARKKGIPVGAVWQSIRQKGTKANPFMEKAVANSKDKVLAIFKITVDTISKL